MRVLVTGAAGFIGSHLADRLILEGHEVVGVDSLETGRLSNVHPDVDFHQLDIAGSPVSLLERVAHQSVDAIAHCAASYADRHNWERDGRTNVLGTVNVCKTARLLDAQRIVYLQTALCYGHDPYGPGTVPWPLTVDQPLNPDNSYAISKTAAEQYIRHTGLPWVSLRLANVYGPRNLSGPIPTFYKRITEGAECVVTDSRRDFVYIDDLLDVLSQALDGVGDGVYHVSSGRDFAIRDVFEAVADALGVYGAAVRHVPRPADDSPSILLDPTDTSIQYGWTATTDLADGIRNAVDWYSDNGVDRTFTHLSLKG